MSREQWKAVDEYFRESVIAPDPVLEEALRANSEAGLPPIDVSPLQGKLLNLLAKIQGARRILEIGTLGGYSTIWMGRALPEGGKLITLEANPKHAEVARKNIARAGLAGVVELRLGAAVESLEQLSKEGAAPFDLIFIDADKRSNPQYLELALRFSRAGTILVCDNVVRDGGVVEAESASSDIQGIRRFFEIAAADPRLEITALQTVGSKGWDGFAIALVRQTK